MRHGRRPALAWDPGCSRQGEASVKLIRGLVEEKGFQRQGKRVTAQRPLQLQASLWERSSTFLTCPTEDFRA